MKEIILEPGPRRTIKIGKFFFNLENSVPIEFEIDDKGNVEIKSSNEKFKLYEWGF